MGVSASRPIPQVAKGKQETVLAFGSPLNGISWANLDECTGASRRQRKLMAWRERMTAQDLIPLDGACRQGHSPCARLPILRRVPTMIRWLSLTILMTA